MTELEQKIQSAINSVSAENASNTPDFILANFLMNALTAVDTAIQQRETWYGRDARPTASRAAEVGEEWVWWEKGDGYAVGPRNVGALAIVFTLDEAQALCKAANTLSSRRSASMDKSEDYKRGWQDAVGECARVAETYDPHIGNPGYERAITGSIAAAIRAKVRELSK